MVVELLGCWAVVVEKVRALALALRSCHFWALKQFLLTLSTPERCLIANNHIIHPSGEDFSGGITITEWTNPIFEIG